MENIPTSYNPHSSRLHISFLRHSLTHTHKHVECTHKYTAHEDVEPFVRSALQSFTFDCYASIANDCVLQKQNKKKPHIGSLSIKDITLSMIDNTKWSSFQAQLLTILLYIYTLKAFFSRMKYGQPLRSELNFGLHLCLFVCWYLFRIVLKSVRKWKSGATDDSCK